MADDIIAAKVDTLLRCLSRAQEEYRAADDFSRDFTRQDAAILNLLRACEAAIDIGARLVRLQRIAPPRFRADYFAELGRAGVLPDDLTRAMIQMVSFRNKVVHDYPGVDQAFVVDVLRNRCGEFERLCALALAAG